jgi:hypothetical protein
MRPPALEIVGITRPQDPLLALDRDLQSSAQDDAALLTLMRERNLLLDLLEAQEGLGAAIQSNAASC